MSTSTGLKQILCILFISFIALISSGCNGSGNRASLTNFGTPAFKGMRNGQYIYYHVSGPNANMLLGMLKISDRAAFCRSYDIKTKKDIVGEIQFFIDQNQNYVLKSVKYWGNHTKDELEFLYGQIALLAKGASPLQTYPITEYSSKNVIIPETNLVLTFEFSSWVPFLGIYSIKAHHATFSYELVLAGQFNPKSKDLKTIFLIEELPQGKTGKSFSIPSASSLPVSQYHLQYLLDQNWKCMGKQPDAGLPHETYWIEKQGIRYAQIGVEELTSREIPNIEQFAKTIAEGGGEECILAKSVKVSKTPNGIRVIRGVIDSSTGLENYISYEICPIPNTNHINTMTFSSLKSIFDQNQAYFERIFNSLKVKQ